MFQNEFHQQSVLARLVVKMISGLDADKAVSFIEADSNLIGFPYFEPDVSNASISANFGKRVDQKLTAALVLLTFDDGYIVDLGIGCRFNNTCAN